MELNTSQPHHSEIISKPSRNPILYIAIGVVVIVIVALGLLVWQKNQEIGSALSELADAEQRLSDSLKLNKNSSDNKAVTDKAMYTRSENDQKTAALLSASGYYCALGSFGCDKVIANVTEFQKVTETTDGFAKVQATNATGQKLTLWLKHTMSGQNWVVFYEGEALPPADVVKKWSIPTDFLAVN